MCIRGTNSIEGCGWGVYVLAAAITSGCIVTGFVLGVVKGWNALSLGLLVPGGAIGLTGLAVGGRMVIRATIWNESEQAAKKRVSESAHNVLAESGM